MVFGLTPGPGRWRGRPVEKTGGKQWHLNPANQAIPRTAQELLDGEAQELTRRCIELAKQGNLIALRLCLERLIPVRRELPLSLSLPKVEGTADLAEAMFRRRAYS